MQNNLSNIAAFNVKVYEYLHILRYFNNLLTNFMLIFILIPVSVMFRQEFMDKFNYIPGKISKPFIANNKGAAAIEYAIMLPIFLIMSLVAIEFGMYFVKDEITTSAVSSMSQAIQRDPTLTNAQLRALAQTYGSGLIKFETNNNYICGRSYATVTQAKNSAPCTDTTFSVGIPAGVPQGSPYYVVLSAGLDKNNHITPLGNFIPAVNNIQVTQSSGTVQVGDMVPPTCTGAGYSLQYDPTKTPKWQCVAFGQLPNGVDCSKPWTKLQYDANTGTFSCVNVPYVFAGGIAWPTTHSPSTYWTLDETQVSWIPSGWHDRITICKHITFNVPYGLPPGGKIIAQGNLIYPGAGNDGAWHSWVVSFVHLDTPYSGGPGSAEMCMANGGNWILDNSNNTVASEHASWTILFIP